MEYTTRLFTLEELREAIEYAQQEETDESGYSWLEHDVEEVIKYICEKKTKVEVKTSKINKCNICKFVYFVEKDHCPNCKEYAGQEFLQTV